MTFILLLFPSLLSALLAISSARIARWSVGSTPLLSLVSLGAALAFAASSHGRG